jgi:GT2 family glycosyltransferase
MLHLVILSYNHPVITARCVLSALKLVAPTQVSVLHNGSLGSHVNDLKKQFPQVEHWILPENRGYSGGVNEAFRRGFEKASWVFLLTNDTELVYWNLDPALLKAGIYSPKVWFRKMGRIDYMGGLFDSRSGRLRHLSVPLAASSAGWGRHFYIPGTAFLMARGVYQAMGPLDESLHTYWEDVDYGARAGKMGIHMGSLEGVEVIHQGRKTTGKDPFYTSYLFQRNRLRVSWRHCPWYLRPLLLRLVWRVGKVTWQQRGHWQKV